jgi:hypothetical protein
VFFFYRLVSSPTENEHALRLSERREETQKASALHCRDSSYRRNDEDTVGMTGHRRNDGFTLRVFPNEVRKPKKQVHFTEEIPPTVGRSGHHRKVGSPSE